MSFQVGKEVLKKFLMDHDAFFDALRKNNKTWLIESLNSTSSSILNGTKMSSEEFEQLYTILATYNTSLVFEDGELLSSTNIPPNEYINSMPSIKVFFYCLYILIFITGVCGNALVCYVVIRNKNMQTVTNLFITNLALSDILLCMFAVPFTPLYLLTYRSWVFGKLFCHLLPYAQGVSVYISAFTLMSIAIDRFFVIIYPFKPRMKIKVCLFIIACVWIAAAILTFPYGYFMGVIQFDDTLYCEELWPREESKKAFGFSTAVLQFIIPFTIIAFCYFKVCAKLRERARSKPGAKSARKEEIERERTRRTNRMLISMVVIFGVSWLPININNLIIDFYTPASTWQYGRAFFFLVHAAAMSSTCYNPFLYAWLNENFRKEFKQVLPCFLSSSRRRGSSHRPKTGSDVGRPRSQRREFPLTPRDHELQQHPDIRGSIVGHCNGRNEETIPMHETTLQHHNFIGIDATTSNTTKKAQHQNVVTTAVAQQHNSTTTCNSLHNKNNLNDNMTNKTFVHADDDISRESELDEDQQQQLSTSQPDQKKKVHHHHHQHHQQSNHAQTRIETYSTKDSNASSSHVTTIPVVTSTTATISIARTSVYVHSSDSVKKKSLTLNKKVVKDSL